MEKQRKIEVRLGAPLYGYFFDLAKESGLKSVSSLIDESIARFVRFLELKSRGSELLLGYSKTGPFEVVERKSDSRKGSEKSNGTGTSNDFVTIVLTFSEDKYDELFLLALRGKIGSVYELVRESLALNLFIMESMDNDNAEFYVASANGDITPFISDSATTPEDEEWLRGLGIGE